MDNVALFLMEELVCLFVFALQIDRVQEAGLFCPGWERDYSSISQ